MKRIVPGILLVAAAASPMVAFAEIEATVRVGVGYSDNIARTETNKIDETLGTVGLEFAATREEGRLTGRFGADVEYISYFDSTFDDDFYGRADLLGDFAIVRDVFSWRVENSWGQVRRDPFEVINPGNVENINYFATGPDLTLRFGPRTRMLVSGRWSDTAYQDTPRDFNRLSGSLAFERSLSDRASLSLNASTASIEYDDALFGNDYDAHEFFGRFRAEGVRTRLQFDAGYTEIEDDIDSTGNPLLRIEVERDVSPRSTLRLAAGTEFSDAGRLFQGGGLDSGVSDVIGAGSAFERRYIGLGWTLDAQRTRFGAGVDYREEIYDDLGTLDRDVTSFYANLERSLTEVLRFGLGLRYEMEQYDSGELDDDRLRLNGNVGWDIIQRLVLSFEYEYFQGDSNTPLREYDESRAWLRLGYRWR